MKRNEKPPYLRAYRRGMLRANFVSLFWAVIQERRRRQRAPYTLQAIGEALGLGKPQVSRWFSGDPNWTVNTISDIADALDLDLDVVAVDRETGAKFTASGLASASPTASEPRPSVTFYCSPRREAKTSAPALFPNNIGPMGTLMTMSPSNRRVA